MSSPSPKWPRYHLRQSVRHQVPGMLALYVVTRSRTAPGNLQYDRLLAVCENVASRGTLMQFLQLRRHPADLPQSDFWRPASLRSGRIVKLSQSYLPVSGLGKANSKQNVSQAPSPASILEGRQRADSVADATEIQKSSSESSTPPLHPSHSTFPATESKMSSSRWLTRVIKIRNPAYSSYAAPTTPASATSSWSTASEWIASAMCSHFGIPFTALTQTSPPTHAFGPTKPPPNSSPNNGPTVIGMSPAQLLAANYSMWKSVNLHRQHQQLRPRGWTLPADGAPTWHDRRKIYFPLAFQNLQLTTPDGVNTTLQASLSWFRRPSGTGGGAKRCLTEVTLSCAANAGALGKGRMVFLLPLQQKQVDPHAYGQGEVVVVYPWYGRMVVRSMLWHDFAGWVAAKWCAPEEDVWGMGEEDDCLRVDQDDNAHDEVVGGGAAQDPPQAEMNVEVTTQMHALKKNVIQTVLRSLGRMSAEEVRVAQQQMGNSFISQLSREEFAQAVAEALDGNLDADAAAGALQMAQQLELTG